MSDPTGPGSAEAIRDAAAVEDERLQLVRLFKFGHGHRIRYDEVDAQGVVGSGSWLNLLHLARVEYLRSIGLFIEGGPAPVQVVVRRAAIEFLAPARFDDPIIIRVRCSHLGGSSARFEYLVDNGDGLRLLVAETVLVCTERESLRTMQWPQVFRERVQELEAESLQIGQVIR